MTSSDNEQLLAELRAIREENRVIREQLKDGSATEFVQVAIEMIRQMREFQERVFTRFAAQGLPQPEPAVDEAVHQVGKLAHPEWASYEGLRTYLVGLESQMPGLAPEQRTKEILAGMAGVIPKTISRHMRFWGLDPRLDWPPSTWPERPPGLRQGDFAHLLGLAAAGFWATLDIAFSGGKIDFVIHMCRILAGSMPTLF